MWAVLSRLVPNRRVDRPRSRGFRPSVEALEDRRCLTPGTMVWDDPIGSGPFRDIAAQPDGKVLTVGDVRTVYRGASWDYGMLVLRLNADGSPDTSFGTNGTATVAVNGTAFGTAIAVQPDGKILVGGRASIAHDNNGQEYIVARLNANGTLDTTFGNTGRNGAPGGGIWQLNPTAGSERVFDLAVLTNASGQLTGIMVEGNGLGGSFPSFAAIKLTPAGQTDTTYGSGGMALVNVGGQGNTPVGMAVTPSGGVMMVGTAVNTYPDGSSFWEGVVARYTLSGALDPTFNAYDPVANPNGTSGYYLSDQQPGYYISDQGPQESQFTAVGLEPDGSIAVGGLGYFTAADGTVQRHVLVTHLSADGVPDVAFGPGPGSRTSTGWTTPPTAARRCRSGRTAARCSRAGPSLRSTACSPGSPRPERRPGRT